MSVGKWHEEAVAHLEAGRLDEAERYCRKVLAEEPGHAKALANLAAIRHERGELQEAERLYRAALAANAQLAIGWFNLANLLLAQGKRAESLEPLLRASALEPSRLDWRLALSQVQIDLDRFVEARRGLEETIRQEPSSLEAQMQLGHCLLAMAEPRAAVGAYRRALALAPGNQSVASNLLLALNYLPGESAESIFGEHAEWGKRLQGMARREHPNDPAPERRLRIGYVSPDLRAHSVAYFLEPVFAARDRGGFELFVYSDVAEEDHMSARLRGFADAWYRVEPVDDAALAARIFDDRIDVLVDLAGHTGGGRRMPLFAMKPAPVQASWLGYLNTTGLAAMDYRITDRHACPPGWERYHTEKLARLPNSQWCAPEIRSSPGRLAPRTGEVTFGAPHNFFKVSSSVLALWSRVLAAVPGSRLLLVSPGMEAMRDLVAARFQANGVDPSRIEFHGRQALDRYLDLHHRIDINLDAFPYTGGTSTCQSLWMGVPVVTLAGETLASRGGASALNTIGLGELVAHSEDEYVAVAAGLATDRARLEQLRTGLRQRMASSPLSDTRSFARDLEAAYRGMWRRWCEER